MEVEKILWSSRWDKDNFIMINEFKYGQSWKIWPSSLSLSLYSTFKKSTKSRINFVKKFTEWLNLIEKIVKTLYCHEYELRQKAKNNFDKYFFKLMNNAIRKHRDIKLVTTERRRK